VVIPSLDTLPKSIHPKTNASIPKQNPRNSQLKSSMNGQSPETKNCLGKQVETKTARNGKSKN
jgi:hypothetical protein